MCQNLSVDPVTLAFGLAITLGTALGASAQELEPLGSNPKIVYNLQPKNVKFINPGWKTHYIRQGDGRGGWVVRRAEYQMLQDPNKWHTNATGRPYLQFRVLKPMDNGELILMGVWNPSGEYGKWTDQERTIVAFSRDGGDTWSELKQIADTYDRPDMTACLGKGRLTFQTGETAYFSNDYGRTWPERMPAQPFGSGKSMVEGNPLVERDAQGNVTRIGQLGYRAIRWSHDGGRNWVDELRPEEWQWQETHNGKTYTLGVSEGSLVRAKNGWLVAAHRTDVPARYREGPHDDNLEGIGVSISKDNGKTWSPIKILFDAGRHHQKLLVMPNGDIVMTMTVRANIRDGKLVSYRRGCDAIVSHDNGLSWDLDHRYVLDEYEYYDGYKWFNGNCGHINSLLLDDGSIITGHNNYLTKGISLIRWQP